MNNSCRRYYGKNTAVPRVGYRTGLPEVGVYKEAMNSDPSSYRGSNVGNAKEVRAKDVPFNQWLR